VLFECLDDQGEIVSVSAVSFVFVVVSIDGMNLTRDLRRTPMTIHCKFSIRFFLLNRYFVLWYNLVINNIIRQYNKEFQCVYEDQTTKCSSQRTIKAESAFRNTYQTDVIRYIHLLESQNEISHEKKRGQQESSNVNLERRCLGTFI
jgi:hypothetical protein